jgi:HK97 family phage prohead protease
LADKEKVIDASWDGSPSRFSDEQYARSCILDRGPDAGSAKQRYSLPIREPDGTLNRNAVHAAASRIGSVDAPEDAKQKARKKLRAAYRAIGEDPPESLSKADGFSEVKSFPVSEFKAQADEPGVFEAIVSVFGNVDHGRERVVKGAFARTLKERGYPPIVWSHDWMTPPIGTTLAAEERDEGLYIKGRLFVGEGEDSPLARQVHTAMKAQGGDGRSPLREFSFAYDVVEAGYSEEDGSEIRDLKDLELLEAGPTLLGMNPETRLIAVKSALEEMQRRGELPEPPKPSPSDNPGSNSPADEETLARIAELHLAFPRH